MLAPLIRSAVVRANSYDPETRAFAAVVATPHPVTRRDARGPFLEILDAATLDLAASQRPPLLDSHSTRSVRDQIGRGRSMRVEGDSIVADLALSSAEDVGPIGQRIADGTVTGVSIGYAVRGWTEQQTPQGRTKRPTSWAITEVTLTSNPADPNARIRERTDAMPTEIIELDREAVVESLRMALDLGEDWTPDLADDATLEDIRAAAKAEMQRRQAPRVTIRRDGTDPATLTRRKADALAFRMAGGELPDDAREFVGMTFRDLAADALTRAGEPVRGLSTDDLLTRAAGAHTTSDFPLVVSNAANKVALESYRAAESPLKRLARERVLTNFKESTSVRLGEMGRLEEMTESGEFTATTRGEAGETMVLSTFGRRFDLSRKLIIDDDANLLGDTVAALGQAAAQTEADILVGRLVDNPAMRDGVTVFHATRGNRAATGTALGDVGALDALDAARKSMRTAKGLDGKTYIDVTPKFLVVGPEQETAAERLLATIYAATAADVNVFTSKLTLLVEPRITDDRWFIFADPARIAALQYAYLSSARGVQIQRRESWDTLGLSFRAFLDFGAGWVDWRGAYMNPGA